MEGHTHRQTHSTEEGDEGGGLDADDIHGHDDNHGLQQHVDQRTEERLERPFGATLVESLHNDFLQHLGQFHTHPEDEDGHEEFGDELDGEFGEGREAVADDGVLAGDDVLDIGEIEVGEAVLDGGDGAVDGLYGFGDHRFGGIGLGRSGDESGSVVV